MARHPKDLSKRERQVLDALYRLGEASVGELYDELEDAASYNAVRVTLNILERKGHVRHAQEGRRYVYSPVTRPEQARASALRHLVDTFFERSAPNVVSTLLGLGTRQVSDSELDELSDLIELERKRRRK